MGLLGHPIWNAKGTRPKPLVRPSSRCPAGARGGSPFHKKKTYGRGVSGASERISGNSVVALPGTSVEPGVVPVPHEEDLWSGVPRVSRARQWCHSLFFQAPRKSRGLFPVPHEEDLWSGGPRDFRARQWNIVMAFSNLVEQVG